MTQQVLRPNGTVTAPTTVTGAASAHAALSDDSDASYINGETLLELGTFTLGTAVTKSAYLRWYGRAETGSISCLVALTDTSVSVAPGNVAASSQGWQNSPAPVAWSQSVLDEMRVALTRIPGTTATNIRTIELYLYVICVEQPVVAVDAVAPDPFTTSTIVPVGWANTLDADGGGQTRYEIKVFDEATSGSGFSGLDPDSDEPFFETGEVVSSATTANVGPLLNGDTYRAYVRVAQTVNGASHWSDWDFDEFTMDVTTSDVDTITATADDANARIQIDVARDTGTEAWELIEVQRSTDGGVSWTDVRFATYVDCTGDADDFQVFDYETANGQNVLYRARATYLDAGSPVTGAWVVTGAPVAWSSTDCWLKSPTNPSLNLVIKLKTMIEPSRERAQGVFPVIGKRAPVVVSDVLGSASGTINILVDLDGPSPEALLEESVSLLHAPPAWHFDDWYMALGGIQHPRGQRTFEPLARWVADFVEVTAPPDPTAGR